MNNSEFDSPIQSVRALVVVVDQQKVSKNIPVVVTTLEQRRKLVPSTQILQLPDRIGILDRDSVYGRHRMVQKTVSVEAQGVHEKGSICAIPRCGVGVAYSERIA